MLVPFAVMELLERRQHLAFSARINFQPSSAAVPDFFKADTGAVYGPRANGLTYGWNADNSANARDRNSSLSPDQSYDTLIHMQRNGDFKWEIAVPNGKYFVHVAGGDPSFDDDTYR